MNKENKNLAEELVKKIEGGELKMRSKTYFILKSLIYFLTAIFFLILSVMVITFVFYTFKISGLTSLSGFGLKGMRDLMLSLPVMLIFVTGVFTIVSAIFLYQYPVTYRRPLIYSVGALLVLMSVGLAIFAGAVNFRRSIYNALEGNKIPGASSFYDYFAKVSPRNVFKGRVISDCVEGFTMEIERTEEEVRVAYGPQTSIYGTEEIRKGDYVIVHGKRNGNVVGAFVVEKIK